jgi:hypothetical protein
MAAAHFKVKALFAYNSEHDDDLKFPDAQIITVTGEEDADWYIGEYEDATGELQSGLFPKNFVERYEPAPPPRPVRTRPKPVEAPAIDAPKETITPQIPAASKPKAEEPQPSAPSPVLRAEEPPAPAPVSSPVSAQKPFNATAEPPPASKPAQAVPAKGPPPPIAGKSSAFKDRLAAFNRGGDAPVAPFKPGGSGGSSFIKKPFVAPPPSLNSYVPTAREPPPQKIYRREEDPEIADRRAKDEAAAKEAGLAGDAEVEEDDAPKLSLKERIALLQKTQAEQAARRTEPAHKEKPKRPPKKRLESYNADESAPRDSIDTETGERPIRGSSDVPRETTTRPPKVPKPSDAGPKDKEIFSDANDADQSAAGETTEDGVHDSSTEDEGAARRHEEAPETQPQVGDEEGETEEDEEEDEVDEETRRKEELRARMAKLSGGGGMAMPGMFSPMPMTSGGTKTKRTVSEKKPAEDAETSSVASPPQRIPIMPMPGFGRTMSNESEATVGNEEDDDHSITGLRSPGVVPDVEDVIPTSPPRAPAARTQGRHIFPASLFNRMRSSKRVVTFESSSSTSRARVDVIHRSTKPVCEHDRAQEPANPQRSPPLPHRSSNRRLVARKPLGPLQSPQIRFVHSSPHSPLSVFWSEEQAWNWILGRLCELATALDSMYLLISSRTRSNIITLGS